jgi:hypothetical protein
MKKHRTDRTPATHKEIKTMPNDDAAYLDALFQLAKALVTLGAQAAHELIEEDLGSALLFDLNLAIAEADSEFHDELAELAGGDGPPTENVNVEPSEFEDPGVGWMGYEAKIFFGNAEEAAAGKHALKAVGFYVEPRLVEGVWLTAYGSCAGDTGTPEIIQNLEALIKPHGGKVWTLGPIGPKGEPAPPRLYEMKKPLPFPTHDPEQPGRSDD